MPRTVLRTSVTMSLSQNQLACVMGRTLSNLLKASKISQRLWLPSKRANLSPHFKTLQGGELFVEVHDGHVIINHESRVTAADNDATNGVAHIIDNVLIPRKPSPPTPPTPTKDIIALAEGNKDLSTFVAAVKAGKLVTTLEGKGPFTVFAPTNEAFAHLNPAVLKWLLEPEHVKELDAILEYHVVSGAAVYSKDLKPEQEFKTVEGREILVENHDGHINVNHYAHVTIKDNGATNGVIHVIDRVLEFHVPEEFEM